MENCESFKGFGFIYIDDDNNNNNNNNNNIQWLILKESKLQNGWVCV